MKIISFTYENKDFVDKFIELPSALYKGDKKYISPFKASIRSEMNPEENVFFEYGKGVYFLAMENDAVVGRCAAFRNPKMDTDEQKTGTIGYFECIEKYEVAKNLLDDAVKWLKEYDVNYILGPMNYSIWNKYRFRIDNFDRMPFYSENYNKEYYPQFFEKYGFTMFKKWVSRNIDLSKEKVQEKLKARYEKYQKRFERALGMGYTFELNKKEDFDEQLKEIYGIVMEAFAYHYGFFPISFKEFLFLFGGLKFLVKDGQIVIFKKDGKMVAFAIHCFDYGKAIGAMKGNSCLISKMKFLLHKKEDTIMHIFSAMLPDCVKDRSGIASAGMYQSFKEFYFKNGIKHILHPTMFEENISNAYSKGIGDLIGTYALYELKDF